MHLPSVPSSNGVNLKSPMWLNSFLFEAGFLNCPSARVVSNYQSSISPSEE
jgi:hypothetical protein